MDAATHVNTGSAVYDDLNIFLENLALLGVHAKFFGNQVTLDWNDPFFNQRDQLRLFFKQYFEQLRVVDFPLHSGLECCALLPSDKNINFFEIRHGSNKLLKDDLGQKAGATRYQD
jgi:hypothetical protein